MRLMPGETAKEPGSEAPHRVYCLHAMHPVSRGAACREFARASTEFGITDRRRRRPIYSSTEAAGKASRWLWIKRADLWESAARAQFKGLINPRWVVSKHPQVYLRYIAEDEPYSLTSEDVLVQMSFLR